MFVEHIHPLFTLSEISDGDQTLVLGKEAESRGGRGGGNCPKFKTTPPITSKGH